MPKSNKQNGRIRAPKQSKQVKALTNSLAAMSMSSKSRQPKQKGRFSLAELVGLNAALNVENSQKVGVAIGKRMLSNGPKISTSAGKVYTVTNRELVIPEITGSETFALIKQLEINPGLSETFPWLSGIAKSYAEYKFKKLGFRYITRSPTTKSGSVMFTPLYDPLANPPSTEQNASAVRGTAEGPVWEEYYYPVDRLLTDTYKRFFIRNGPVAADLKTYDPLGVVIYTNDCVDSTAIGKLWVEYEVDFFEPVAEELTAPIASGTSLYTNTIAQTIGAGETEIFFNQVECNSLKVDVPAPYDHIIMREGCYILQGWILFTNSNSEYVSGFVKIKKNGATVMYAPGLSYNFVTPDTYCMSYVACIPCMSGDYLSITCQKTSGVTTLQMTGATMLLTVCSN